MGKGKQNEYDLLSYEDAVKVIEDKLITGDFYRKEIDDLTLEIAANFPESAVKPAEEAVAVTARVIKDGEIREIDELDFSDETIPDYSFTAVFNRNSDVGFLFVYQKE